MKNKIIKNVILAIFIFIIVFPLLTLLIWIFTERYTWPHILPNKFSMRALNSTIIKSNDLLKTFTLSIWISLIVSFISVSIAVLSARAFAFYKFRGKSILSFIMLSPFLVPGTVFAMGIQIFFLKIGLGGSVTGVIICHVIYSLPYANKLIEEGTVFLGNALEEQARVLGCSELRAFFEISLPNLIPVILSAFTMSYIISISQYFLTLLIGGGNVKTISVVMVPYMQSGERNFSSIYAVIFLIVTIVIFVIFDALAKYFVRETKIEYFR